MAAREWVERIKQVLGSDIFSINTQNQMDEFGVRTINDMFGQSEIPEEIILLRRQIFSLIEEYRPPIEEKYSLLFELEKLIRTNPGNEELKNKLVIKINSQGLGKECADFLSNPKPIMPIQEIGDDGIYCPRCGARLTEKFQNELLDGHIVLCYFSKDVWMYLKSDTSKSLF